MSQTLPTAAPDPFYDQREDERKPSTAAVKRALGLAPFLALFGVLPGHHKRWYPHGRRSKSRGPYMPHQGTTECARRRRQRGV